MDDRRVGLIIRALRSRRVWRQVDLADAADISQSEISRIERGHFDKLSLDAIRRVLAALDARAGLEVRWRGAEIDRLLDERHAAIGSTVAAELERLAWPILLPEVTFMRLGERGSIDLVAADPAVRAAAIFELKSELTSYEETQRRLDAKIRIAASVIEERLGWRPRHLAAILVLDDTTSNRDRVSRVAPLIRAALPAGNVDIRRWLKSPAGDLRGIWFLRGMHPRGTKRILGSPHRVRRPTSGRPQA